MRLAPVRTALGSLPQGLELGVSPLGGRLCVGGLPRLKLCGPCTAEDPAGSLLPARQSPAQLERI